MFMNKFRFLINENNFAFEMRDAGGNVQYSYVYVTFEHPSIQQTVKKLLKVRDHEHRYARVSCSLMLSINGFYLF